MNWLMGLDRLHCASMKNSALAMGNYSVYKAFTAFYCIAYLDVAFVVFCLIFPCLDTEI